MNRSPDPNQNNNIHRAGWPDIPRAHHRVAMINSSTLPPPPVTGHAIVHESAPPAEPAYSQYVTGLLSSYTAVGGLNNRDSHNMPSTRAVGRICLDLLQLLFPGFHDDDAVHHGNLSELTGERLSKLALRLEDQVRKSVRIGDPKKPTGRTPPILRQFFLSLPEVRELLRTDIEAAYEGDPAALYSEEIILSYPFIEAIAIQRLAHVLYSVGAPIIPRMMTEWAHSRTGIDIHPGACIGSHFFIDHGTGVVIGETCLIGNRVKLYHGVTLGARSFTKDSAGKIVKGGKRHPEVRDNVTIYPNSTILGGETVIGANSTIGANVFLMHSVPPDSLVIYEEKQLVIHDKSARRNVSPLDWII
jgi:serine O-acetyltransferase